RDILRKSAQAVAHMNTFRSAADRKLTIGYIAPVLATMLTPALSAFSRKHKDLDVILKELSPQDQIKALREGRLDLALPGNPCPELSVEFEVKILRRIPFFAVLPEDHRLASRKRIGLGELKAEVFVGFDEDSFPGRNASICDACQQAGFTPQLRRKVGSLSALLATVASGKGVTLTPEEVGQLPHPGAVIVALKAPVPSVASAAVYRKGESNPDITTLLSLCKKAS
ncbi:MAG TPA: LysR family substrate-binding domain-containing protein, partial [Roseimicrobium sp.]|nr:LysR family substrate-binding domain-containing protein [Roseimicrobium sp.]